MLFTPVVLLSSLVAPTTTVSPETATEMPKSVTRLRGADGGGLQIGLLRPRRPAAHEDVGRAGIGWRLSLGVLFTPVVLLSSQGAPTTTVSPETATDEPNWSPACVVPTAAASDRPAASTSSRCARRRRPRRHQAALSLGVLFTPVVLLSSSRAPTTTVSPETATELPNWSPACVVPTAAGFR